MRQWVSDLLARSDPPHLGYCKRVCVLSSRQVRESYFTALLNRHTHAIYTSAHQRGTHGRGMCQGTCLISVCLIIHHFLSFSPPNRSLFQSHPIYLFFHHEFPPFYFSTLTSSLFLIQRCLFSLCRQTCLCCRGSCSTVPGWPSRLQLNIWPNTSSFSWTPMPARRLILPRSCWR